MIKVVDLHKSFGDLHVLKGVNEHIKKGEVVSVIGPSGSGKSTFLRCLNLLETPEEGHIIFDGTDITDEKIDINVHRQKMGMVFQHFNVFPHITVKENITLAPTLVKKVPQKEADIQAMELLARVGLADKAKEYPRRLSGGQKQRLALARALLLDSRVYIFDEATSNIDADSEEQILDTVRDMVGQKTILFISHRLANLVGTDRIYCMERGEVTEQGSHEELLQKNGTYAKLWQTQYQLEHFTKEANA